jgi:hypothetical protein
MKQTAVEWLQQQYNQCPKYEEQIYEQDWEQAKEMEKQQIIDAYKTAEDNCEWLIEEHRWQRFHSEQYYNETFKKNYE